MDPLFDPRTPSLSSADLLLQTALQRPLLPVWVDPPRRKWHGPSRKAREKAARKAQRRRGR